MSTKQVLTSPASRIPPGVKLFRIGTLALPGLTVEAVQPDKREEMEGWVDVTVWVPNGQRGAWTDPEDATAFLGMIALSVPATALATYEVRVHKTSIR